MFLNRSREAETFAQFAQGKGLHVLEEYAEFVKSVVQKNPNTFIVQYVTSAQLPPLLPDALPEQQLEFLRRHALDKVNFNAAWLINSDVFTVKALEYFAYFRDPKLSNEALEKAFMLAVDSLLNKARINEIVYQSVVDYLINGYKDFGFDKKIIDYLVENYVIKDDLCLDGITEALIKKRIDQAKILKIGAVAPNIILPDSVGREVDLSRIDSERLLLVFYASWCPHCKKLLPKINALYMQQKHKTVEVLGVSLDTGREDWLSFTRNNSIGFINVCDLKGGNSKAALDYLLYATPGMFFLDRDKRIISKPVNIEEVQALFQGK
jgi:peroxiredoxin